MISPVLCTSIYSVLSLAAKIGDETLFKLLLSNGADIKQESMSGSTPLHFAVKLPNLSITRIIMEKGVDVNKQDGFMRTAALHIAVAREGNLCQVQYLIEHGADVSLKTFNGETPLHYASYNETDESYDIYKLLLENGADCNAGDDYGSTPFHYALKSQSLDVIKLMVSYGADITVVTEHGWTTLHCAASNPHADVVEFLLDHGLDIERETGNNRGTTLDQAIDLGNSQTCEVLLRRGTIVNKKCEQLGTRPLFSAVYLGQVECVQVLLEHGANIVDKISSSLYLQMYTPPKMMSILEFALILGYKSINNLLVQQMVKMEYLNLSINEDDRKLIKADDLLNAYCETCSQEFERMKIMKFYNNVSVFHVSMGSMKVISGYAKNEELISALDEEDCENKFPIYFVLLKKRFFAEVERQRLQKTAIEALNELLEFSDPFNIISQEIVSYLTDNELRILQI